jgi:hypothetical protein
LAFWLKFMPYLKKRNKYNIYSDPDACARDLFFNTPL